MNQNILIRLEKKAEKLVLDIPASLDCDEYTALFNEKLAELIVRECLSVGEDVANADGTGPWFEGYVSGVEEVNRRIKQHFGVEE